MPPKRRRRGGGDGGHNSLAVLVQALVGQEVCVELKSDHEFLGTLDAADSQMNTTLRGVEARYNDGRREVLENVHLLGRMIRYVHIPDAVSITGAMEKQAALRAEVRRKDSRMKRR